MKKAFFVFIFILSATLFAQDDPMKAWTEYMTPGEMHQWLAQSVGVWNYTQESWMSPGAAATVDTGISKHTMILGGRYLQIVHEGSAFGTPFTGANIIGYDNKLKKFFSFWIDNLGTGYTVATGDYDKTTNTITLFGSMVDPVSDSDYKYKMVIMQPQSGKVANEMYGYDKSGKEFLMMRSVYKKAE